MKLAYKALAVAAAATLSSLTFADTTENPWGLSFSGTAAMTSDYRFRGVTQAQNDPAVQVGFTASHDSGLYAGAWGSNIDFGSAAHLEIGPYLGFATELENFAGKPVLDVGAWYYIYPSESDLNWLELYSKLTFNNVFMPDASLAAGVNYSNDFIGDNTDAWYFNLSYAVPFAGTQFGAVAGLGYTLADKDYFGDDDKYLDWKVGVTYSFASVEGLSAELAAVGSDIDYGSGTPSSVERGVETGAVFTLTKAF